jgi:hypothetical protein
MKTVHLCRQRQKEVAKIVHCGENLFLSSRLLNPLQSEPVNWMMADIKIQNGTRMMLDD